MRISLDIPDEIAHHFADNSGGGTRAVLEALALEGVRSGKLTVYEARQMLGISSHYEMDGFLKEHGVFLPLTLEDVCRDSETATEFAK